MPLKMTGLEFKAFLDDPAFWPGKPGETFVEDEALVVNDDEPSELVDHYADMDKIVIHGGRVRFANRDDIPLVAHAKAWMKKQTAAFIIVETTKENRAALEAIIKSAGGKIL